MKLIRTSGSAEFIRTQFVLYHLILTSLDETKFDLNLVPSISCNSYSTFGPGYLLSVVQLMQRIKEINNIVSMPHPTNQNSVVWNTLADDGFEMQHLNCSGTVTRNNESLTVNIIYLKGTLNYDFWISVEIHPQGNPKASQ